MAQNWNRLDNFRTLIGSTTGATDWQSWYNARPDSSYVVGQIHDGYLSGKGGAAIASSVPASTAPLGFMFRRELKENQRASIVSAIGAESGQIIDNGLVKVGILGRIQGGTINSAGTTNTGKVDLTCYEGVYEAHPTLAGEYRYRISRWNAGVETELATTNYQTRAAGAHRNPFTIQVQFATFGVFNQIRIFAQFIGDPVVQNKLDFTELATVGIAGPGDMGMICTGERTITTPQVGDTIHLIHSWEAIDSDDFVADLAGTVRHREEWERSTARIGSQVTDNHGTTGFSLHPGYSCSASGRNTRKAKVGTGDLIVDVSTSPPRSGVAELDGVSKYLNLVDPDAALVHLGVNRKHQVTVAVWATLDQNRDGNELFDVEGTGTLEQDVMLWGLRTETDIGGQAAASFEFRVRTTQGVDAFTSYSSAPFVIATYLGECYCYAFTYQEGYFASGDSRVRFWIGRHGDMELIEEVSIDVAHAAKFDMSFNSPQIRIGKREHFTGTATETYLLGQIQRIDIFSSQNHTNVPGQAAGSFWEMDSIGNEYLDNWEFDGQGEPLSDHLHWNNGWRFDDLAFVAGRNLYYSKGFPSGSGSTADLASFEDQDGSTDTDGDLPTLPPDPVIGWYGRKLPANEGNYREGKFTLNGEFDRCGIYVRGAVQFTEGTDDAYKVEVGVGSPAPVSVYRVIGGVETFIARQNPDSGTRNVSLGSQFTLSFEAWTLANTGPTGPTALEVQIGGLVVPLERWGDSDLNPDVTIDLNGAVIDYAADRLTSAFTDTGFFGLALRGTGDVQLDDWDGTTSPTVGGDDIANTATLAIPSESASVTGNLSDVLTPSWRMEIQEAAMRVEAQMESGRFKRANLATEGRRVIRATRQGLTDSESEALLTFWDSHNGGEIPFTADVGDWLRGEASGSYVFVEHSLQVASLENNWITSFEMMEAK